MMLISPAQGAVFAPMVLKFVQSGPFIFFHSWLKPSHSAPTRTINLNWTNLPSPGKRNRNEGAIIGGVAAIIAVIGIVTLIQRRRKRRRSRPSSILSSSNDSWDVGLQMIVTPFNPDSLEPTQGSGILEEQQPLVSGNTETEIVTPHHLSSSLPSRLPLSRPGTPFLVGLSDKEIARLCAEALNS